MNGVRRPTREELADAHRRAIVGGDHAVYPACVVLGLFDELFELQAEIDERERRGSRWCPTCDGSGVVDHGAVRS